MLEQAGLRGGQPLSVRRLLHLHHEPAHLAARPLPAAARRLEPLIDYPGVRLPFEPFFMLMDRIGAGGIRFIVAQAERVAAPRTIRGAPRELWRRYLPSSLRDMIEVDASELKRLLAEAAAEVRNSLVLGAGVGRGQYRDLFSHTRYIGVDLAVRRVRRGTTRGFRR